MRSKQLQTCVALTVLLWGYFPFNVNAQSTPISDTTKTELPPAPPGDEEAIYEKVDNKPTVDVKKWRSNLEAKLLPYIESALKQGIRPGKHVINVMFIVEKDGSVGAVKALNDPGFGLAKGAETIIKTGPKWNPGEQSGRKVRCFHTQPITFFIQDEVIYN